MKLSRSEFSTYKQIEEIYMLAMENKINFLYQKAKDFPYEKSKYSNDKSYYRQYNHVFTIFIQNKEPFARTVRSSQISLVDFSSIFEVSILNLINPQILTIIGCLSNNCQEDIHAKNNLTTVK